MTNEEAKAQLEVTRECMRVKGANDIAEALDMAIKALEQQPNYLKKRDENYVHYNVEWLLKNWQMELDILSDGKIKPCEDCISREAVIDIINFEDEWLFDAKSHNADTKIAFSGLKSKVKDLPSVTPKADVLDKIRAEIDSYGAIWVEYKIPGNTHRDIENIVENVLKQAKEQVLEIIDKYKAESEDT